ncbi:hypothetical protein D3C75_791940 [compost metagenome]
MPAVADERMPPMLLSWMAMTARFSHVMPKAPYPLMSLPSITTLSFPLLADMATAMPRVIPATPTFLLILLPLILTDRNEPDVAVSFPTDIAAVDPVQSII